MGIDYSYTGNPLHAWLTVLLMDVWHWTPLIRFVGLRPGLRSNSPMHTIKPPVSTGPVNRGVLVCSAAEDGAACLMIGVLLRLMDKLHDLYRAFCSDAGGGQCNDLPVAVPDAESGWASLILAAAAFSLIYFLIILLMCFILYNWMQRVGTQEKEGGHE